MGTRLRTSSWRILFLIIVAVALAPGASAQTPQPVPAGPLTLEQVLELAEARSEAIAAARAGIRRAEGEQVRARSGRLPQLSASGGYNRALASEFEGLFDGAGPSCDPFTLNPAAALDARVAEIERAIDCGAVGSSPFGGGGPSDGDDAPDLRVRAREHLAAQPQLSRRRSTPAAVSPPRRRWPAPDGRARSSP